MNIKQQLHIVILAAGKGVRMCSTLPKALQPLAGMPLLGHVIVAAHKLQPEKIHVVHGSLSEELREQLAAPEISINWVEQKDRLGTGHAVMQALPHIPDVAQVLILYADVPLISRVLLQDLIELKANKSADNAIALITAELADPSGFGRIIRSDSGENITGIVEQKDASVTQLAINEINTGIMLADTALLKKYLAQITPRNAQGEYYLTDVIGLAANAGFGVAGLLAKDIEEVLGVNDKAQLAELERLYQRKIADKLMRETGVTLIDPARIDVRGKLTVGKDTIIDVNVVCEGNVVIGDNCKIGANNVLRDVRIADNVEIRPNCVLEGAEIADDCIIGPFARIRPITKLAAAVHIGNFVEVKNTTIAKGSKANHLAYLGDSVVGERVNVGAGAITCNYDGANKYQTIIEDDVFVGSDVQFIAPVKVGKGATIAAGSTITQDAPAGKLTISRARQTVVEHWQRPKKK